MDANVGRSVGAVVGVGCWATLGSRTCVTASGVAETVDTAPSVEALTEETSGAGVATSVPDSCVEDAPTGAVAGAAGAVVGEAVGVPPQASIPKGTATARTNASSFRRTSPLPRELSASLPPPTVI